MRMRSRVVRCGAWFVLLLNVGCAAAHAASGMLIVTVLRGSPSGPALGAVVTIIGTATGSSVSSLGKASFTLLPGTYQVRATLPGFCTGTVTAVVTEGGSTNVTVTLGPLSGPCPAAVSGIDKVSEVSGTPGGGGGGGGSGNDRVTTGGSQPLYALLDIRIGTSADAIPCENDRLVEGSTGVAEVMTNALALADPSVTCHGAAWVFTSNHAPWFSNAPASLPWTNSTGDVLTPALPAGRLRVPVTFWLSDPTINNADYQTKLTSLDLPAAEDFLLTARTGLRLTNSTNADTPPDIVMVSSLIGSGCTSTPDIVASTTVFRVDHINVYVIDKLDATGVVLGRNCAENGAANVIFVDDNANFVTLVHEIGHGLGLMRPQWGHSNKVSGMHNGNFMWSGASAPIHATLGQIARMHADTQSWLNKPSGAATVRTRQPAVSLPPVTPCSCPGDAPTDDCPKVDLDIPRSGAASTPPANPACFITATPPCLSIPLNGSVPVTANGWVGTGPGTAGSGGGKVASLTPSIVTVAVPAGGEGLGFITATVTARGTAGTGRILLTYGGNMIEVPVKVDSSCP
jgi:hypothetical protein